MYTLTLKQFEAVEYAKFRNEYPGTTKQDFKDCFNSQDIWDMWLDDIATDKNPTSRVLNRLYVEYTNRDKNGTSKFFSFVRFHSINLPQGWLNPGAIQWNKENRIRLVSSR